MIIFPNESRPDLAVGLTRQAVVGSAKILSPLIFPHWGVAEKGGSFTAAQRIEGSATSDRAHNVALTGTQKASTEIEYTITKLEDRATLDEADIKNHGGEEPAKAAGALQSARTVIFAVEAVSAAAVFDATAYAAAETIDADEPWKEIADAARGVKYYGEPHLFCSESWLSTFVSIEKVAENLLSLFGDRIIVDVLGQVDTVLRAVGQVFGVKGIHVGDDDAWDVSGKTDAAAVVAIRPEAAANPIGTVKAQPSYGIGPMFLPDPANPETFLEIDTAFVPTTKVNAVDATAYYKPTVINSDGHKLVKLPASES